MKWVKIWKTKFRFRLMIFSLDDGTRKQWKIGYKSGTRNSHKTNNIKMNRIFLRVYINFYI